LSLKNKEIFSFDNAIPLFAVSEYWRDTLAYLQVTGGIKQKRKFVEEHGH
jgi:hypothetical protein